MSCLVSANASATQEYADASAKIAYYNRQFSQSATDKEREIKAVYDLHIAPAMARAKLLNNKDLHDIFSSIDTLWFFANITGDTNSDVYLNRQIDILNILRTRNDALSSEYIDSYNALVTARRFEEAKHLLANAPEMNVTPIPVIQSVKDDVTPKGHAILELSENATSFSLRPVQIDVGDRIVIVAGCHFSEDAARDINSNNALRSAFLKGKAIWLEPAEADLNAQIIQEWNQNFPDQKLSIAYHNSEWKGIDFARIPNFYFYKSGHLIGNVTGWKRGYVDPKIYTYLHEMGLL